MDQTPLHFAALLGNKLVVKQLIDSGAEIDEVNSKHNRLIINTLHLY